MAKLKTWREIPIGGVVLEGGTAEQYLTGGWRTLRPVKDEAKCTNCMICWVYCPDTSILAKDGKMVGFDLEHCKGCGICAMECPVKVEAHAFTGKPGKVIQMVEEAQFRGE